MSKSLRKTIKSQKSNPLRSSSSRSNPRRSLNSIKLSNPKSKIPQGLLRSRRTLICSTHTWRIKINLLRHWKKEELNRRVCSPSKLKTSHQLVSPAGQNHHKGCRRDRKLLRECKACSVKFLIRIKRKRKSSRETGKFIMMNHLKKYPKITKLVVDLITNCRRKGHQSTKLKLWSSTLER